MNRERKEPSDPVQSVADPAPAQSSAESQGNSLNGRRFTRWLPLAGNVGALIGLLLVAVQLQQNRDLMRAQIRHELAKQKEAWGATLATAVAFVAYWCEVRTLYSPLFMTELDGLLTTRKCAAA
jgi:hypothetical protein